MGVVKEVMCLDQSLERREGISRCVMVRMVVGDRHTEGGAFQTEGGTQQLWDDEEGGKLIYF